MVILDKSKRVLEKSFGIQKEKDQSKSGTSRENRWKIASLGDPKDVDTAGVYRTRVTVNVTVYEKE